MSESAEPTDPGTELGPPATGKVLKVGVEQRGPLLVQMWTEYFRHLSTLGVAGSAGVLILVELEMLVVNLLFWIPLVALASGSILALYGARTTLDLVEEGGGTTKKLKFVAGFSTLLLGFGAGALTAALLL